MKKREIDYIRKACKINDIVFSELVKDFRFKTERELENFILRRFREMGAGYAYEPIVANNNIIIHAKPRKQRFSRGFLVLDFGARVNGYCSDMTRTIFLGKADKFEKKLYHLILNCQVNCLKKIKAGVGCRDVDAYARRYLGKYKKYFIHALGHGVGWKVHQKPVMRPKSEEKFKLGDVVAVEPGIYLKHIGKEIAIRVEDTCVVGRKGVEVLSKCDKGFVEIDGF